MNRLHTTAAALMVLALATPGCSRNRNLPTQLAPSQVSAATVQKLEDIILTRARDLRRTTIRG